MSNHEGLDYSGGGQGKSPKPVTKIRGTQWVNREQKKQVVKRPIIIWINPFSKKKGSK